MFWKLFIAFAKIGGLTFGGGYAMLPMLQKEVVEKNRWATSSEVMDYYALGQCAPGIIATNTAAFIGYRVAGVSGALAAVLGAAMPSFVIIVLIAGLIKNISSLGIVQNMFAGIRVAVAVLVLQAIIKMWKSGIKDMFGLVVFAAAFVVSLFMKCSPILVMIIAVFAGIIMGLRGAKK